MVQIQSLRKNKIHLQDYDYKGDIQKRLLLSHLSALEVELLEEILFNRLEIPLATLQKNLSSLSEEKLLELLRKLLPLELYVLGESSLSVDKEKRKYYESHLMKFSEDFKPDLECLLHLLKKVPIHILPVWYSIPKSSNNIFQSIIEKFLLTPQIYQRYCFEVGSQDPIFTGIMNDVFSAKDLQVYAADIKEKYSLSEESFQEYVLYLEFHFICALRYVRTGDIWEEVLTPFHEWKEFLSFLRDFHPQPLQNESLILQKAKEPFAFVQDMERVLKSSLKTPLKPSVESLRKLFSGSPWERTPFYLESILIKIEDLGLAIFHEKIIPLDPAKDFIAKNVEDKALFLYRHPSHRVLKSLSETLQEKQQREIEKSLKGIDGWVYFEEFLESSLISLREEQKVCLTKKSPKNWHYQIPSYTQKDKDLVKSYLFSELFFCGMIEKGLTNGKDCFRVSDFGKSFFS